MLFWPQSRSVGIPALMSSLVLALPLALGCGGQEIPEEVRASDTPETSSPVVATEPGRDARVAATAQDPARPILDMNSIGYDQGSPDAPIKVIEVSDFGCGYCRVFNQEIFPEISTDMITVSVPRSRISSSERSSSSRVGWRCSARLALS